MTYGACNRNNRQLPGERPALPAGVEWGSRLQTHRYGELVFDEAFGSARRGEGGQIVFTRAERLLLSALLASRNRVLSRNQLLDAISGAGSDSSDRNVDFIVNRLRGKLGDSARTPVYIATRYGEGYVWVAEPSSPVTETPLLLIGPMHGLARSGALAPVARALRDALLGQFDAATSPASGSRSTSVIPHQPVASRSRPSASRSAYSRERTSCIARWCSAGAGVARCSARHDW